MLVIVAEISGGEAQLVENSTTPLYGPVAYIHTAPRQKQGTGASIAARWRLMASRMNCDPLDSSASVSVALHHSHVSVRSIGAPDVTAAAVSLDGSTTLVMPGSRPGSCGGAHLHHAGIFLGSARSTLTGTAAPDDGTDGLGTTMVGTWSAVLVSGTKGLICSAPHQRRSGWMRKRPTAYRHVSTLAARVH